MNPPRRAKEQAKRKIAKYFNATYPLLPWCLAVREHCRWEGETWCNFYPLAGRDDIMKAYLYKIKTILQKWSYHGYPSYFSVKAHDLHDAKVLANESGSGYMSYFHMSAPIDEEHLHTLVYELERKNRIGKASKAPDAPAGLALGGWYKNGGAYLISYE